MLKFVARESDRALTTQVGDLLASPAGANAAGRIAEVVQLPNSRTNTLASAASDIPGVSAAKQIADEGLELHYEKLLDGLLDAFANPKANF